MSYGSSASERDRLVGIYVARILKGEKTTELPVIQASKFELVINQQTTRPGIMVPPTLLAPPTRSSNAPGKAGASAGASPARQSLGVQKNCTRRRIELIAKGATQANMA
jgi:hypothetical protein